MLRSCWGLGQESLWSVCLWAAGRGGFEVHCLERSALCHPGAWGTLAATEHLLPAPQSKVATDRTFSHVHRQPAPLTVSVGSIDSGARILALPSPSQALTSPSVISQSLEHAVLQGL